MLVPPTSKDENANKSGTSPSPTAAQPQTPASFSGALRDLSGPQQTTPPSNAIQSPEPSQGSDSKDPNDPSAPQATPSLKASGPTSTTDRTTLAACTKSNSGFTCLAGVVFKDTGGKNSNPTVIATWASFSPFGVKASAGVTHGSPKGPFQVEAAAVARMGWYFQPYVQAHGLVTRPFQAANFRVTPYAGAQTADPRTLLNPEQTAPLASAVRIHVGPDSPTAYSGMQFKYPHRIPTISGKLGYTKWVLGPQDSFGNVELRAAPREPTSVVFTFTTTPLEIRNPSSRDLLYKFQATIYTAQPFKNTPSTDQASKYGLKFTHTVTSVGIEQGIRLAAIGLRRLKDHFR